MSVPRAGERRRPGSWGAPPRLRGAGTRGGPRRPGRFPEARAGPGPLVPFRQPDPQPSPAGGTRQVVAELRECRREPGCPYKERESMKTARLTFIAVAIAMFLAVPMISLAESA